MSKHHTQEGQEAPAPEPENAAECSGIQGAEGQEGGDSAGNAAPQAESAAEDAARPVEGDSGEGGDSTERGSPAERVAELEAQLAETRDQLLRKAADFENFRKRMNQEKQNAIEYANQSLLLDLIPVIDDFERAIQSAESSKDFADLPAGRALLDGITMIEKRLTGQLESKWGLKRFDSAGEPFDPNRHEALMMEKSADITEPVVREDLQKGYTLKDRVIRAAKVKVLMPGEHEGVGNGE